MPPKSSSKKGLTSPAGSTSGVPIGASRPVLAFTEWWGKALDTLNSHIVQYESLPLISDTADIHDFIHANVTEDPIVELNKTKIHHAMWFAVFGGTDAEMEAEVRKIRDLDLAVDAGDAWLALWKTRTSMEDYLKSCIDGGYRFVPDMLGRMNLFIEACKKQKAALVPVPPPSAPSTMVPSVTGAAVYHSKAVAEDTADHTTPPFKYVGHSSKAAGGKKVSGERVYSSTFFGRIPEDGGKIAFEMSKDVSALILLYFKASRGYKRESGYPATYVPYPTALWSHHYTGTYDVFSKLLVAAINRLVVERGETTPVGDAWQNESKHEGAAKLSKFFIENAPQFGELGASPIEQLGGKQVATIPYWFFEVPLTNGTIRST